MKSRIRKSIMLLLAVCLLLTPVAALADGEPEFSFPSEDSVGNVFINDQGGSGRTVALDMYGAGQNLYISGTRIGESALLAGYAIDMLDTGIGGSLRAAAYQISAGNTSVGANATLAAAKITLGPGFSARCVYATAQDVSFSGTCDALYALGQSVTISGTVNGPASIYAENVQVLDGAVITDELTVYSANAPVISDNSAVASLNFQQTEQSEAGAVATDTVAEATFASIVIAKLITLATALPGRLLLVVLFYFIIRKTTREGADMMKTRAVAMPVSGLIALISVPIAAILVMCTVIGVPVGVLVLCLYGLALGFAVTFAACMTGQLVFPKMHALLAGIIAAAILSILLIVPILGGILRFACIIYTLGYFIQRLYLNWTKKPAPQGNAPADPEKASESEAAEASAAAEAPVAIVEAEASAPADNAVEAPAELL